MASDDGADRASLPSHSSSTVNSTLNPKRKPSRSKRTSKSKASKTSTLPNASSSSSTNRESGTTPANPESQNEENDDNDEEAPRRRGHKGNFHGARLKFLEASLLEYVKAKPRTPCLVRICSEWFEKWPWHDKDKQPEQFDALDSPDADISADARAELIEERKKVQEAIQVAGKGQIERWFYRNAKKASTSVPLQSTPLAPLLRKALGFAGGAPRRAILYKFWMKQPENQARVQEAVQARLTEGRVERAMLLKLRCDVAESLFEDEPEDVKQEIEERVNEIYQQQMEVFKRITTGETVTLEELGEDGNAEQLREVCRESLTKFLQPLLDLLRLYTGLKFCLLAGAPPPTDDDDFFLLTINSGECTGVNPQTFQNWHNDYFTKNVMALFMLFLCNQNPKDLLGEPGLIHPDTAGSGTTPTPGNSIDDPSLIRMPEEQPAPTDTTTSKKRRRRTTKNRKRARTKDTEKDSEDEESGEDELTFKDQDGNTVLLSDMKGRIIETRDTDVATQHFEAESTPEPNQPLPEVLKEHLATMLTESRRDIIGMLNSQPEIVQKHNIKVLTRKADVWKAAQQVRSPSPIHNTDSQIGSEASGLQVPSSTTSPRTTSLPTISHAPALGSVRSRCGSVPLGDIFQSIDNIFQLDDHANRLASSISTRTVNIPVRFSSVPTQLPADTAPPGKYISRKRCRERI
ncbi:hypothetical protein FB446DRAFT_793852 [Lentinula raphanica]|nr:hypothetical protein FB446DRAFT_793852 [Lentinula raphanica]